MTEERWSDDGKRNDGVAIVKGAEGYVIWTRPNGLAIERCPCCNKTFALTGAGFRAARLVADMLYPMTEEAAASDAQR